MTSKEQEQKPPLQIPLVPIEIAVERAKAALEDPSILQAIARLDEPKRVSRETLNFEFTR